MYQRRLLIKWSRAAPSDSPPADYAPTIAGQLERRFDALLKSFMEDDIDSSDAAALSVELRKATGEGVSTSVCVCIFVVCTYIVLDNIYIYICIHIYIHIYIYIYIYIHREVWSCMHVCKYVCMYVCLYIQTSMSVWMFKCMYT